MGLARAQQEFAHDASHRLRDPITMCRGQLELLESDDDREEQRKTIALVLTEVDRMGRIVDDLQVLAESGGDDFLRPGPIDLAPFAHELVVRASTLAPRRWALDDAAEGTLVADEYRLSEALVRLAGTDNPPRLVITFG
jgi:two-component system, OmpR family, sensor kinase